MKCYQCTQSAVKFWKLKYRGRWFVIGLCERCNPIFLDQWDEITEEEAGLIWVMES